MKANSKNALFANINGDADEEVIHVKLTTEALQSLTNRHVKQCTLSILPDNRNGILRIMPLMNPHTTAGAAGGAPSDSVKLFDLSIAPTQHNEVHEIFHADNARGRTRRLGKVERKITVTATAGHTIDQAKQRIAEEERATRESGSKQIRINGIRRRAAPSSAAPSKMVPPLRSTANNQKHQNSHLVAPPSGIANGNSTATGTANHSRAHPPPPPPSHLLSNKAKRKHNTELLLFGEDDDSSDDNQTHRNNNHHPTNKKPSISTNLGLEKPGKFGNHEKEDKDDWDGGRSSPIQIRRSFAPHSVAKKRAAAEMVWSGASLDKVAQHFSVSVSTVSGWLERIRMIDGEPAGFANNNTTNNSVNISSIVTATTETTATRKMIGDAIGGVSQQPLQHTQTQASPSPAQCGDSSGSSLQLTPSSDNSSNLTAPPPRMPKQGAANVISGSSLLQDDVKPPPSSSSSLPSSSLSSLTTAVSSSSSLTTAVSLSSSSSAKQHSRHHPQHDNKININTNDNNTYKNNNKNVSSNNNSMNTYNNSNHHHHHHHQLQHQNRHHNHQPEQKSFNSSASSFNITATVAAADAPVVSAIASSLSSERCLPPPQSNRLSKHSRNDAFSSTFATHSSPTFASTSTADNSFSIPPNHKGLSGSAIEREAPHSNPPHSNPPHSNPPHSNPPHSNLPPNCRPANDESFPSPKKRMRNSSPGLPASTEPSNLHTSHTPRTPTPHINSSITQSNNTHISNNNSEIITEFQEILGQISGPLEQHQKYTKWLNASHSNQSNHQINNASPQYIQNLRRLDALQKHINSTPFTIKWKRIKQLYSQLNCENATARV